MGGFAGRAQSFNPRSRVGSDVMDGQEIWSFIVSIHAPAWGATTWPLDLDGFSGVSIHAPAWGATLVFCEM